MEAQNSSDELHKHSAYTYKLLAGEPHQVSWKLFDVAAFKETLKVYNQFQQNVEKREDKLNGFATKLLVMDGERAMEPYADESEKAPRDRLGRFGKRRWGNPAAED